MKILVCIKQVPGTSNVDVDEKTGVLKRDGVESKMNPFDLYAIEQALCLREAYGGTVDVITMGPPQAKSVLLEAVYMGADNGGLISDRKFAGADVVATSYTLSQGIRKMGEYDLILCGKQTTDGDTAQVGPETAEFLGMDHMANVQRILAVQGCAAGGENTVTGEKTITVEANMDRYLQQVKMVLPCLLTIDKGANTPRLPSYRRKMAADENCIQTFSIRDFADQDEKHYGLAGSPTQVERIFPPQKNTSKEIFEGDADLLTTTFVRILGGKKFI